ncbi:MFS transporter [Mesorhizobium sp. BAC0120]|uniref:MFS transporter n=1 Tax=Mesorhizobium sp. BAC0120 TaxID=3090670 RepID=UPI00298D17EF|nr:MFS transporter [Mesorhizobium sp. BAC0120]MDW6026449.1 MFS transporter [Mesorhizobium sp. BAC0120]
MQRPPLRPEQLIKPRHFEARIALIFASLFVSTGINLPYFPLWLEANGFGAEQIAVILAAPMFLRVVTTPFLTAYADRAKDRVDVLLTLVGGSVVLSCGFFLPPVYGIVLAVSLALSVVWTPHGPLADSLALSGVRRFGSNYTRMRIWGSISFLAANLGGGIILSRTSPNAVPAIITASLAVAFVVVLMAPRLGRPRLASPLSVEELQEAPKLLNRQFLLFIAGAGLISGSHGFMYGFASIYWKSIGLGDTLIGFQWAFAVVAEVCVFMIFTRVFGRFRATTLVLIGGAAAIVRWIAYPLVWPAGLGVAGFFFVQGLHCLSTAIVIIAVQKFIAEAVDEERTGAAQGAAFFANGICMAVVTLLSGPLYGRFGADGFFAMIGVAVLGIGLILVALSPRVPVPAAIRASRDR